MKKLKDYLFELLVIFLGISLSFYVDEWREDRENKELLHNNLRSIKLELVQDTVVLSEKMAYVDSSNSRLNPCLTNQRFDLKGGDHFEAWIDMIATLNYIVSHNSDLRNNNASFKNYTQNSFSQYLENAKLRGSLSEYYEIRRIELLENERELVDISEKLRSFVLAKLSFYRHTAAIAKGEIISLKDLKDISEDLTTLLQNEEFLNYLSIKLERINVLKYGNGVDDDVDNQTYSGHIDFIKDVITEIDLELKR